MSVPSVLPNYKVQGMARSGRETSAMSSFVTCLLFSPVMIFFFMAGIFLGSSIVHYNTDPSTVLEGSLPNTNNILGDHLRGNHDQHGDSAVNHAHVQAAAAVDLFASDKVATYSLSKNALLPKTEQDFVTLDPPLPASTAPAESSVASAPEAHRDSSHPVRASGGAQWSQEDFTQFMALSYHADYNGGFELPSSLDTANVVFGVWIYLDNVGVIDGNMRTVFSNKATGCESSAGRNGVAVFVNEWLTSDHKLYVEFGNEHSGCNKVSSGEVKLNDKVWYHVAVSLVDSQATLYLDGVNVGSASGVHSVQQNRPIQLGQYGSNEYPFLGNLSHFTVAHPMDANAAAASVQTMRELHQMSDYAQLDTRANIRTLFTLHNAIKKGSKNRDVIGNLMGKVQAAPSAKNVKGVKIKLVDGLEEGREVTEEMKRDSDTLGRTRREHVKAGMQRCWVAYRAYAWGMDELKPQSKSGSNNWGGLGVTLVDSLDTLWVMGMKEEFEEAAQWVKSSLTFSRTGSVSVFETTIRELGGLIAAHDLSKNKIFLDKAVDLGDRLIKAFSGGSSIPQSQVDLSSGQAKGGWSGGSAVLSELGTLQVEFRYLSMASGDPKYERTSMKAIQAMYKANPAHGLYPIKVGIGSGRFTDQHVTFGALGDSFYEYLLKVWIQGGKKETWLREMYDKSIDGVMDVLLKASSPSGLAYISDWDGRRNIAKMDHLVCFMPGVMALGAYTDPLGLDSARAQRDLSVAKALMFTCREMYHRTETGISPEFVNFPQGKDIDTRTSAPFYILRPETAESLFVLNQLTGDPIYREWAYEIWSAIDKHCRNGVAYGALRNVNMKNGGVDNRMESFFLAETLKYLYLAQDPDNEIDVLHKYVFNTEAHPTRIFDDGVYPSNHVPIQKY